MEVLTYVPDPKRRQEIGWPELSGKGCQTTTDPVAPARRPRGPLLEQIVRNAGRSTRRNDSRAAALLNKQQKAEWDFALRRNSKSTDSGYCLTNLGLTRFLISFSGSEFFGHGFLKLVRSHAITFGSVHENVFAAGGGSLIQRTRSLCET